MGFIPGVWGGYYCLETTFGPGDVRLTTLGYIKITNYYNPSRSVRNWYLMVLFFLIIG